MTKYYISTINRNMAEEEEEEKEACFKFRLRKIHETRNYLLNEKNIMI